MPIFTQSLQKVDPTNPQDAIRKMARHINHIQEQLEYKMYNLDSQNIREIDTDKTTITDSTGSANIGAYINITGANGESFSVGRNTNGKFEFSVKGKGGTQTLYVDSSGNLVITKNANLTIDGGEW
jgi:hypothetical protein